MGSNTTNLSLYKPAEGEDGWASQFNTNLDDLDTILENDIPKNAPINAVREGYIAAIGPRTQTVIDPRDETDGTAALQAANDFLTSNLVDGELGIVHFGPTDPDGTELVISDTVVFGDRTSARQVIPRGHFFAGNDGDQLNVTITDGSHMFEITSNGDNGGRFGSGATPIGGWSANANGNNAGGIRLVEVQDFDLRDVSWVDFNPSVPSHVVTFDTRCFNASVHRMTFLGKNGVNCEDAVFFGTADTKGGNPPSDIHIGSGVTSFTDSGTPLPARSFYRSDNAADAMVIGDCRIEGFGANGNPVIEVTANGQDLFINDPVFGRAEGTNSDYVYFNGNGQFTVGNPKVKVAHDTGGDIINVPSDNPRYIHINDFHDNAEISGNAITIGANPDSDPARWVVPREGSFTNTVDYPTSAWRALRYHDGWQFFQSDTTTLSSGGRVQAFSGAFNGAADVRIRGPHEGAGWEVVSDAVSGDTTQENSGGHIPVFEWSMENANNERTLFLEDTNGGSSTGDINIKWYSERVPTF